MPAKYTMQTLPEPNDSRVKLVTLPGETYAVYRYTGTISATHVQAAHEALIRSLQGSGYAPIGEVVNWYYDPPWTLPPLRRNEAAVEVEKESR
jgi:effector-binding domain-containing protein